MVPNVRTSLLSAPPELATSRQATTLRLWTSIPQHRACTTSMGRSSPFQQGTHVWTAAGVPDR
jgi:hypothetical protein